MNIELKEINVDEKKMKAEIDVMDSGKVYIVQDGKIIMIPIPDFGTLEMKCQDSSVFHASYAHTVRIK